MTNLFFARGNIVVEHARRLHRSRSIPPSDEDVCTALHSADDAFYRACRIAIDAFAEPVCFGMGAYIFNRLYVDPFERSRNI